MPNAPALLLAGLGLSFLGLELVTNALQESTSRTLRSLIRRSTRSTPACAMVGVAAGALVQSTSTVATVLGSMTSTGMTTIPQAIPVVAFANVGTTILVFASALDIRFAVMVALGLSGIAFSMATEFRWKAAAAVALGLALILYGSDLMTTAAGNVQGSGWFVTFLRAWHESAAMAFTLGCLASFLTQSTTLICLVTIAVANVGLIDPQAALAMLYGANLGSTLMRMLLTRGSSGAQRQISRFQDVFKTLGTALFVLLLVVERMSNIPGVYAAISALPVSLPVQLAVANLALNGSMALVASVLAGPLARLVVRRWPPDLGADLGAPMYAVPEAVADAATAIDLLEKEQMRMVHGTRDYMVIVRARGGPVERGAAAALHRRFGHLFRDIEHFHALLVSKPLDDSTSTRIGNTQARQKVVELLEDSLHQMATTLEEPWRNSALEPLIENVVEALDFLLMSAEDAARTLEFNRADMLFNLSGDRSEMMAGVRNMYLSPDRSLSAAERATLLRLTALFERIVWMVQRYAELLLRNIDPNAGREAAGAAPDR